MLLNRSGIVVKIIFCIFLLNAFFSCENGSLKNNQTEEVSTIPSVIYFSDLVNVSEIDSVRMYNNAGKHSISLAKLAEFKEKLSKMTLNNGTYKMGSIRFLVYIGSQEYYFGGRTNGQFIETTNDILVKNKSWVKEKWLYFESKGFNLDNY